MTAANLAPTGIDVSITDLLYNWNYMSVLILVIIIYFASIYMAHKRDRQDYLCSTDTQGSHQTRYKVIIESITKMNYGFSLVIRGAEDRKFRLSYNGCRAGRTVYTFITYDLIDISDLYIEQDKNSNSQPWQIDTLELLNTQTGRLLKYQFEGAALEIASDVPALSLRAKCK